MHVLRAISAAIAVGSCGDEVVVREQCLELSDADAECPEGEEAEEALFTDGSATLIARYGTRTLEQDGQTYELPAECCYEVETLESLGPSHCGMGRPYVVAGRARVASMQRRGSGGGWGRPSHDAPEREAAFAKLAPETRTLLANRWRARGLLEHASVASFAQFTLDLMSFGAPASLVRESLAAGLSEVRHAELCFELAHEIDGQHAAPGPLATPSSRAVASRQELTARLFQDACVEETLGALELSERQRSTSEPRIAKVLARLVADELKHAALAWRALAWLCQDSACRSVVQSELALAELRMAEERSEFDRPELAAFGEPSAVELRRMQRDEFARVVKPATERLLQMRQHAS